MAIRVVDRFGAVQDWAWVQAHYGAVTVAPVEGDGYRVIQLTEIEGWQGFTCTLLNVAGGPVAGQRVDYVWPDNHQIEITNANGTAEHSAGSGEAYAPPSVGPVTWRVLDSPGEAISGLGWLALTQYRHLQVTMQWSGEDEPPPPPEGDVAAAILELAGAVDRLREQIARSVHVDLVVWPSSAGAAAGKQGLAKHE